MPNAEPSTPDPSRSATAEDPIGRLWLRAESAAPWAVWLAMTVALAGFVGRFGYDLPFWDEWALVPLLTGHEPVTLAELWSPLNEHRILLGRVVMLIFAELTGGDWRAGMAVSVAALSAAAAVAILAARTARGGRTRWTDAAFPLLLLHWGQAENLLWNIQMIVTLPVLLSVAVVAVLIRPTLSLAAAAAVSVGLLLLGLCGGFGLMHLPGLIVVVALRGLGLLRGLSDQPGSGIWGLGFGSTRGRKEVRDSEIGVRQDSPTSWRPGFEVRGSAALRSDEFSGDERQSDERQSDELKHPPAHGAAPSVSGASAEAPPTDKRAPVSNQQPTTNHQQPPQTPANRRAVGTVLLLGAALTAGLLGVYFVSRVPPAAPLPPPTPERAVLVGSQFLLTGWGHAAFRYEDGRRIAAAVTVGLGLLAVGLCARTAWADPQRRWPALAVLAGLAGLFLGAALVAWGRGSAGDNAGLMVRYVTLAAPLMPMLLLALALTESPAARALAAGVALTSAALLVPNATAGLAFGRAWEAVRAPALADLRAGWPSEALVARHAAGLTPHPQHAVERLEMMRRARFGPFRTLAEPNRVADPLTVIGFRKLAAPEKPRMLACVELYGPQAVVQPLPSGPGELPLAAVDVTLITLGHRLRESDRIGWQIRTRPTPSRPTGRVLRTGELATVSVVDWQPARLRVEPPLERAEADEPWELVLLGGSDTPRPHGVAVVIWEAEPSTPEAASARAEPSPDPEHGGGHDVLAGVGTLQGFAIWGRLP